MADPITGKTYMVQSKRTSAIIDTITILKVEDGWIYGTSGHTYSTKNCKFVEKEKEQ